MTRCRPETIMRNIYGVFPALVMQAGIELDIFTRLHEKPMGAALLAETLNVAEDKLSPLLYAMVSYDLLRLDQGVFSDTEETGQFLVRGEAPYKEHVCFLIDKIWNAVSRTAETISRDRPQTGMHWSRSTDQERSVFLRGQFSGSLQAGNELVEKVDCSTAKNILDAAGGSGAFAIRLSEACKESRITVADLPEVVPATRAFLARAGIPDRIRVLAVDLVQQPPDGFYDAAVTRSFIQVLSAQDAGKALKNIGSAIVPGGSIHIVGRLLEDSRLSPRMSVAHNLLLLNLYEEGGAYTEGEYRCWLESAGFAEIQIEHSAFSDGAGLISARKV